ncbi:hypothetical protein [Listeria newyorkensis]|uniref:hypothetical protein n=1 Tax=Listeria newyorkensis TaxID=1497681 RepID=UPI00051DE0C3|nr:hypothetical protein [Listeria newyorkensis]KGL43591.1 hypothetical protein EP58_07580 [Listeria newyorkensis]
MQEKELYEPVRNWLYQQVGCEDVYAEVWDVDVFGTHGACNVVVELKTSLSFKLLDQAVDRVKAGVGHYVYIAIPATTARGGGETRFRGVVREIITRYGIGILTVDVPSGTAHVLRPAKFNRNAVTRRKRGLRSIREGIEVFSKDQIGGSKGGETMTSYKYTINSIKKCLREESRWHACNNDGWMTVDQILEVCETHYAKPRTSVMQILRFDANQIWCESKKVGRTCYFRYKTTLSSIDEMQRERGARREI